VEALQRGGFDVYHTLAGTLHELSQALAEELWEVLLAADDVPGLSLDAMLALVQPRRLPVLAVTATADLEAARAALRAGAVDVIWPAHLDRLPLAVDRARLSRDQAIVNLHEDRFVGNRAVQLLIDPQTGQVVDANPAAVAFYGYSLERLRRMLASELDVNGEPTWRANRDQARSEPNEGLVTQQRLASGEVRDVEIFASPVQQGQRALLYCIVSDVTRRQRRERELAALATFAAGLRTAPSRARLGVAVITQLCQLTGAARAALLLRDPATGSWATEQAVNWTEPGRVWLELMISGGQPQWQALEPIAPDDATQPWLVGVPLTAQGLTLGALGFSATQPPDEAQLRLFSALGDMAANALHRSTLHEQAEQRVQRLAALHAIDIAITASFDLHVTLGIFLDHLINLMRVDAAAVLLLKSFGHTLEYAATRGLEASLVPSAPLRLSDTLPGRVAIQRQALLVSDLREMVTPGLRPYPPGEPHFTGYYGMPLMAKGRVLGVLEVLQRARLQPAAEWLEFFNSLATQGAIAIDNATLFADLQRSNMELNLAYDATIEGWSRVLEARGVETTGHTRRVADLAVRLAQSAGFNPAELINVRRGALLHDVGMLSIPETVLHKPAALSDAERAVVQQHPEYGFGILAPISYLAPALDIPRSHHERWDGSGYPRGLRADRIPAAARLFAVVDTWDALTADKPYRPAWSAAQAQAYLEANAGKQFDPRMVQLFVQQSKQDRSL
jgi:PAS domain S-box-containing protein